jgi:hypothetical protein
VLWVFLALFYAFITILLDFRVYAWHNSKL